jgi:hypothetical protein
MECVSKKSWDGMWSGKTASFSCPPSIYSCDSKLTIGNMFILIESSKGHYMGVVLYYHYANAVVDPGVAHTGFDLYCYMAN